MAPASLNESEVRLIDDEDEDALDTGTLGDAVVYTDGNGGGIKVVSKHDAALKVVAETGCNLNEARNMIDWLDNFVKRSRRGDHSVVYPRTRQMSGRNYEIFDQIMPHDSAPDPGTAAEAVNDALLDRAAGETYILHSQREQFHAVYCSVQVQTLAVQLS